MSSISKRKRSNQFNYSFVILFYKIKNITLYLVIGKVV